MPQRRQQWRAQTDRRANGHPRQALQHGQHKQLESHIGRHRIARQPQEPAPAQASKGQRPAGLDGDAPEIQLPHLGQHGPHPVRLPHRHATAGDQQIQIGALGEPRRQLTRIVGHRAQIRQSHHGTLQQRGQHGPVAVVQVARRERLADGAQFRAGGQYAHPHRPDHGDHPDAERRHQGDLPRIQGSTRRYRLPALREILARPAHVFSRFQTRLQRDPAIFDLNTFLGDDRIGPRRHYRAGHEAQAGSRRHRPGPGRARQGPADDAQPPAHFCIRPTQRIAV